MTREDYLFETDPPEIFDTSIGFPKAKRIYRDQYEKDHQDALGYLDMSALEIFQEAITND